MSERSASGITIERATLDDVEAMFDVSVAAHSTGYESMVPKRWYPRFARRFAATDKNRTVFTRNMAIRLARHEWTLYVAKQDGLVVGYHGARQSGGSVVFRGLFVDPQYQGQGIGRALFEILLRHFKDTVLELKVLKKNARAISLYESHGFVRTRRLVPRFFGAPQIVMVRTKQG